MSTLVIVTLFKYLPFRQLHDQTIIIFSRPNDPFRSSNFLCALLPPNPLSTIFDENLLDPFGSHIVVLCRFILAGEDDYFANPSGLFV
jgi:hypothetical protein